MISLILIGFKYAPNKKTTTPLPGVSLDINRIIEHYKGRISNAIILSNIKSVKFNMSHNDDNDDDDLRPFKRSSNSEICKHTKTNIMYNYVSDAPSLLHHIKKYCKYNERNNRVIVYYSGHGRKGNMMLPNDTRLSFSFLLNTLVRAINVPSVHKKLLVIADCCDPGTFDLPYKFSGGTRVSLTSTCSNYMNNKNVSCMVVTSASVAKKAITHYENASFFTCVLLEQFRQNNINIDTIRRVIKARSKQIGHYQIMSCYTSERTKPFLWSWCC